MKRGRGRGREHNNGSQDHSETKPFTNNHPFQHQNVTEDEVTQVSRNRLTPQRAGYNRSGQHRSESGLPSFPQPQPYVGQPRPQAQVRHFSQQQFPLSGQQPLQFRSPGSGLGLMGAYPPAYSPAGAYQPSNYGSNESRSDSSGYNSNRRSVRGHAPQNHAHREDAIRVHSGIRKGPSSLPPPESTPNPHTPEAPLLDPSKQQEEKSKMEALRDPGKFLQRLLEKFQIVKCRQCEKHLAFADAGQKITFGICCSDCVGHELEAESQVVKGKAELARGPDTVLINGRCGDFDETDISMNFPQRMIKSTHVREFAKAEPLKEMSPRVVEQKLKEMPSKEDVVKEATKEARRQTERILRDRDDVDPKMLPQKNRWDSLPGREPYRNEPQVQNKMDSEPYQTRETDYTKRGGQLQHRDVEPYKREAQPPRNEAQPRTGGQPSRNEAQVQNTKRDPSFYQSREGDDNKRETQPQRREVEKKVEETRRVNPFSVGRELKSVPPKSAAPAPEPPKPVIASQNRKLCKMSTELGWAEVSLQQPQVLEKTHMNSLLDFYVQTFESSRMSTTMTEEIYSYMQKNKKPMPKLEIGSLCLAPFEDTYFRGEIVSIHNEDPSYPMYGVYFCDFGNESKISGTFLYDLPDFFRSFPRCAINCQWDVALTGEVPEDVQRRALASIGSPIIPQRMIGPGQYIVSMLNLVAKNPIMLAVEKVEEKKEKKEEVVKFSEQAPAAPVEKKGYNMENTAYSANIANGKLVKISFVWNLRRYLIGSAKDEEACFVLQNAIEDELATLELVKEQPMIGDILLGLYEQVYYRGAVIAIKDEGVELEFLDFGDTAIVPFKSLRIPSKKIMEKHPIYGMNVTLAGLTDPGKKKISDAITALCDGERKFRVEFERGPGSDAAVYLWMDDDTSLNDVVNKWINSD